MLAQFRFRWALVALACALTTPVFAQHAGGGHHEMGRGPGMERMHTLPSEFDHRFGHDHYYPARGSVVPVLPAGSRGIAFGRDRWFFHGGVWFRPYGTAFIVGFPPFGIVVPLLPPAYTTLWLDGATYYYANGVYYSPVPDGYAVVAPPADADTAQVMPMQAPAAPIPDPVIYPRAGQDAVQTEADRQACQQWALGQAGAAGDPGVAQRGLAACMDGRGYTVR